MSEFFQNEYTGDTAKLEERVIFFFVCMGVVTLTYGFFFLIDFLPEKPGTHIEKEVENMNVGEALPIAEEVSQVPQIEESYLVTNPLPVSIIFDTLDREVTILNPEDDSAGALDTALLSGVVRHPGSADFENKGTIFLLGHSSYLPVVNNKNFQAFNDIQKLVWGDTIRLRSEDMEYVYSVDRVYEVKATTADDISIERGVAKLTLATCNSFGTKDDRFIVEASLVESRKL